MKLVFSSLNLDLSSRSFLYSASIDSFLSVEFFSIMVILALDCSIAAFTTSISVSSSCCFCLIATVASSSVCISHSSLVMFAILPLRSASFLFSSVSLLLS